MSKRKKWNDELNYFEADAKSTWKYEPFKNRDVTIDDVADIVWKKGLYKKVKRGEVVQKYTRCFRTYVYRELVERKVFDGNAIAYTDKYKGGKGNWTKADKAIDAFNKKFKGTPMEVANGRVPKKSGTKKDTPEDIMRKLLEAAKKA